VAKKPSLNDRVKWSLVAGGTAAAAGFIARKGLEQGWRWWWEKEPPENPASPDVTWGKAMAWAAASAAVIAIARLIALRGTAAGWKSVHHGRMPPV
jgi:hypothetical protein